MARFSAEAMELTLRAIRGLVATDEDVRLLLADVGVATLQNVVAPLIDRRHIALPAVSTFVERHVRHPNAEAVAAAFIDDVRAGVRGPAGGRIDRQRTRGRAGLRPARRRSRGAAGVPDS